MAEDPKKDAKPAPEEKKGDKPAPSGTGGPPPAGSPSSAKPAAATRAAEEAAKQAAPGKPAAAPGKQAEKEPAKGAAQPPGKEPEKRPPAAPPGAGKGKPPPPGKKRRGCLAALLWLIVIVIVIGVGGYYTWPYWSPYARPYIEPYLQALVPPSAENEKLAALDGRLGKLEETARALAKESEVLGTLPGEIKELRGELDEVLARLEKVEQGIASLAAAPAGGERMPAQGVPAELEQRLAKLETEAERLQQLDARLAALDRVESQISELEKIAGARSAASGKAAAAALALERLGDAVKGSGPFATELDAVKTLIGEDPVASEAIAALEPYATKGVPTAATLYRRFPEVADAVAGAESRMQGEGWVQRTVNRLRSLVTIRRTGEAAVGAGGTDAALALAEKSLAAGDLRGAVAALESLKGNAADAAKGWLRDAKARLRIEQAFARLQLRIISLLAAKEG